MLELVDDELGREGEEVRNAMEWAQVTALAVDGVFTARDPRAVGDQPADGQAAGYGRRAAVLSACAGRVDARSVRGGDLQAHGRLAGHQAPRVTELLRDDFGYVGSVDLVRKRMAALRPRGERPAQRPGYRPGQLMQVDWAEMLTRPKIAGRDAASTR